jgi:hypothetical protein
MKLSTKQGNVFRLVGRAVPLLGGVEERSFPGDIGQEQNAS